MTGYSDRINHAFAFAAKHYGGAAPVGAPMSYFAHPNNVAVILARYQADQTTIVAGILHHVLEEASPDVRPELEHKIGQKFGPVALAVAKDAVEPKRDPRGVERSWGARKQEFLAQLAAVEPRALDICVADEIHVAGAMTAALRRLGREYLRTVSSASSEQTLWWYRSLLATLDDRVDWPRREMTIELRLLSADVLRTLRTTEESEDE